VWFITLPSNDRINGSCETLIKRHDKMETARLLGVSWRKLLLAKTAHSVAIPCRPSVSYPQKQVNGKIQNNTQAVYDGSWREASNKNEIHLHPLANDHQTLSTQLITKP
jgi:hypothetical protein